MSKMLHGGRKSKVSPPLSFLTASDTRQSLSFQEFLSDEHYAEIGSYLFFQLAELPFCDQILICLVSNE